MRRTLSSLSQSSAYLGQTLALSTPIVTTDWAERHQYSVFRNSKGSTRKDIEALEDICFANIEERIINPPPMITAPLLSWEPGVRQFINPEAISYLARTRRYPGLIRAKIITATPTAIRYYIGRRASIRPRQVDITHDLILAEAFLISSPEEQRSWAAEHIYRGDLQYREKGAKVPDAICTSRGKACVMESLGTGYSGERVKKFVNFWQQFRGDGTCGRAFKAW